jgi:hypothetical protein
MPIVKRNVKIGNLFDSPARMKIITTCGIIKNNGELTMGKGIAETAVCLPDEVQPDFPRYPKLASKLAMAIRERGEHTYERIWKQNVWYYGFVAVHFPERNEWIGAFQTKGHFTTPSRLSLIGYSIERLKMFFHKAVPEFPEVGVIMNFPGIGLGGLDPIEVSLLLKDLPPFVDIYRMP